MGSRRLRSIAHNSDDLNGCCEGRRVRRNGGWPFAVAYRLPDRACRASATGGEEERSRLLLCQRFPGGQLHCQQLALCGSASRHLLPLPLLQMAIQRAEAQTSIVAKLAPRHTAAQKL